jgi:hypothetical protein
VHFQNIANEHPFMPAQWLVAVVSGRFLDHFVKGLAQALAIARASDQAKKIAQTRKGSVVLGLNAATRGL